jgi:RNA polymerase sigma-32 factor
MYSAMLRKSSGLLSSVDTSRYVDFVKQLPRLTHQQEVDAIHRYRLDGDDEARSSLICSCLWLGVWASQRFKFMGDHQSDFIQECTIGIIKALRLYDTSAGVKFSTFASIYVKAEAHNYMVANWRMVKVATTKAKRKVFHNLFKHMGAGERLTEAKIMQLADELSVSIADVRAIQGHLYHDVRMGSPINEDGLCIEDQLFSDYDNPEQLLFEHDRTEGIKRSVGKALKVLNERETDVIVNRVFTENVPVVLGVLSERYNVSRERIRQIEMLALKKMRQELEAA